MSEPGPRSTGIAAFVVCMGLAAAVAAAPPARPTLNNGDLIFQESQSSQSSAILAATGSKFTHMGIVAVQDGKASVIEAGARVHEISLDRWIAHGRGGRYALYRVSNLSAANGQRVVCEARRYQGRPYDIFFRFGDDALYCSELPVLSFRTVGIDLGRVETFGALNTKAPQVRALFAKRWKKHPDCRKVTNADACWAVIQKKELVTPASIAADSKLKAIFSDCGHQRTALGASWCW